MRPKISASAELTLREHIPLEQELRQPFAGLADFNCSQRAYSIRTRIKTPVGLPVGVPLGLREHIPLEQGLRQLQQRGWSDLICSESIFH